MPRLAFTTFGIMKEPYGTDISRGYEELEPSVDSAVLACPGLIARAEAVDDGTDRSNFERDWGEWGTFCVPRFYQGGRTRESDSRASTVSLWRDIQSVYEFSYSGIHRETLMKRGQWFLRPEWPSYAMWWVGEDEHPTWRDACVRLENLHDRGSTPKAFDFKRPFHPDGSVASVPTPVEVK